MKVAIIGLPKTGTTALYESIKAKLPRDADCSFEPKTLNEVEYLLNGNNENVLAKFMFGKVLELGFDGTGFDKVVVIVRDPRDYLVSSLLYRFDNPTISKDIQRYSELLKKFETKQKKPSSISFTSLSNEFGPENWDKHLELYYKLLGYIKNNDVHVLRYEDFCDNQLQELSEYLGVEITNKRELTGWTSKIQRKGKSGDWKNWFTDDDLILESVFGGLCAELGYDDWQLPKSQVIEKEYSIDYIKKLAAANEVDPTKSKAVTKEYIENLYSAARDNKQVAILKLGIMKLAGEELEQDILGAFMLLKKAAEMGSARGAREVGKIILERTKDNMAAIGLGADFYFEKAVELEDPESCYYLGQMFQVGSVVDKNDQKAFSLFLKGAELGSKSCMRKVAVCYRKGLGTKVSEENASFWEIKRAS